MLLHFRHDPHWRPIWYHCNICAVQYDLIIKVEELNVEEPALLNILNLTYLKIINGNQNSAHMSAEEIASLYFQQLNSEEIQSLYKIYENDFKLFGYGYNITTELF